MKYFTNGHKFHQTSNFKQVITLSKNQSLKDILFRKETNHVRDGTTITDNGIDLDESLVELIDNYSPCPCKNDMEPIDKL